MRADIAKSVHAATRKTLLKVKGFSEVKVEKIKEAIQKLQVCSLFASFMSHCGYCPTLALHAERE